MSLRVTESEYAALTGRTLRNLFDELVEPPVKPSKYRNKKTTVDGITFDSLREMRRWYYLIQLEKMGAISELRRQVAIPIYVNNIEVCFYVADHVYNEGGIEVWEDVKGKATEVYALKKKLILALYGKEIKEVRKN